VREERSSALDEASHASVITSCGCFSTLAVSPGPGVPHHRESEPALPTQTRRAQSRSRGFRKVSDRQDERCRASARAAFCMMTAPIGYGSRASAATPTKARSGYPCSETGLGSSPASDRHLATGTSTADRAMSAHT
jgi:hypothetical protein